MPRHHHRLTRSLAARGLIAFLVLELLATHYPMHVQRAIARAWQRLRK